MICLRGDDAWHRCIPAGPNSVVAGDSADLCVMHPDLMPKQDLIVELRMPRHKDDLGTIGTAFKRDVVAVAYTCFGDLFLQDCESSQIAIAFLSPFELVRIDAYSTSDVQQLFEQNPEAAKEILKPDKVAALVERLGSLKPEEIYIPVPIPALGGDGSIESYETGNLWTHVAFVTG